MNKPNKPIESLDRLGQRLVRRAFKARKKAYAPYSNYLVGCALIDKKKKVHSGCNVENASYGGCICAERVAVTKMVSRGSREFVALAVITSSDEPIFPCGICLQVLTEFGAKGRVIAVNRKGSLYRESTVGELFPYAFSYSKLKG